MKIKKIPDEYFITIMDRLSRFQPANIRYERVFDDIISKFSANCNCSSLTDKLNLVEEIFNYSLGYSEKSLYFNQLFLQIENIYFESNEISYRYLSTRLNYAEIISKISKFANLPKNLYWLINLLNFSDDVYELRKKKNLLYPIEKIILCEGQTEELLLEPICKILGLDFSKYGIKVISAGGKNQVARKYYKMVEYTKLPFFILLDRDASKIKDLINTKLRAIDDLYLIKSGEFEDIIPKNILLKTINYIHKNDFNCYFDDFSDNDTMVHNLENIYKKYGFGEYKKADFAKDLANYIQNFSKAKDFDSSELLDIANSISSSFTRI